MEDKEVMEQEEEGKEFTLLCRSDTCKGRQGNREGCGWRASDFSAALRSLGQVYREPRGKVCQLWESHTGQRGPDSLSKHWLGAYWGEHQHKGCVVIPKFWRHSSWRLSLSHPPHNRFFEGRIEKYPSLTTSLQNKIYKIWYIKMLSLNVCRTMKYDKYIWASSQYADLSVIVYKNISLGTSLVVQWLRISFAMKGTQVQSLVGELRSHMPQNN